MLKKYDLIGWSTLIVSLLVINIYCQSINLNADSSFPLRYITSIFDPAPHLLAVQPGNRIFPEWLYSAIIYPLTNSSLQWLSGVMFLNIAMLAASIYYFCRVLLFTPRDSKLICSLLLCLVPALNLLHPNVLAYFIFSPGIHGFYIPYIVFGFALTYQILTTKTRVTHKAFYFCLLALCGFSNVAFLLALLPPGVLLMVWLKAKNQINWPPVAIWSALTATATLTSYVLITSINQLESITLISQSQTLFDVGLKTWLFENNRLYAQLSNRDVAGYSLEILLFSIITSVVILFRALSNKIVGNSVVINLLFIPWLFVFVFAMWSINKGNVRWIPFLLFFSPLLLLCNLNAFTHWVKLKYLPVISWIFIIASVLAFVLFKSEKSPYVQYHQLIPILKSLHTQNKINKYGLADYWVGNTPHHSDFQFIPISAHGKPRFFATDLLHAWSWSGNKLHRNKMTFIVNVCNLNMKCAFNEGVLLKKFGQFDEKVSELVDNKFYLIYIYQSGINLNAFYGHAERLVKQHAPSYHQKYLTQ